ncbi:MAG TPA: hypothetical protein G4O14_02765 [Anaerolineae bacterium]|nr:hypothetical protein [Anaerolineae bacterium]
MILTEADEVLLPGALRHNKGFATACKWYMDWEPLPKQWAFHQIEIPNMTFIGGIAAGKTFAVAASYLMDCLSIPYFGALNTSVTSTQAELVFEIAMSWIDQNERLEHLIEHITLKPFPMIDFKNFSYWHFRTMGKDAKFIRGSEYDRINVDEAGLDYEGLSLKRLRGRLRGKRPDKTIRMARLDVTTSPTDAPWLRDRFDRGTKGHPSAMLDLYRSIRATIYENTHLTKEQIHNMEADYTDEMIDVELKGLFPDYGMTTFPRRSLDACTSIDLDDEMTAAVRPETGAPKAGYRILEHPRHGIVKWEMPIDPRGMYVLAGDPGTGDPPKRNSPCVMVARVDRMPYEIVYFDWVFGHGSYMPFLNSFKYAIDKYQPVLRGMDATGTQKAINELAFENVGIYVEGLNFQRDKQAMINALSIAVTNQWFRWPHIKGLLFQMRHYRREDDKVSSRQPQDIVMTMAELALLCRFLPDEIDKEVQNRRVLRSRKRRTRTVHRRRK